MRDRVFFRGIRAHGVFGKLLLKNTLGRSRNISKNARWHEVLVSKLCKPFRGPRPLVINKLALVKWLEGMRFSSAQHHATQALKVSEETGAYLHFAFTRGLKGINYIADRGQHAGGSRYYRHTVSQTEQFSRSPVYSASKRYQTRRDLGPFLIGPAGSRNI